MRKSFVRRTLLMFVVVALSLILFQAGSVSSVQSAGATLVGDSGYFEVAGVAHINQSPYVCTVGSYCYVNFTSFFATPVSVTMSVDTSQLDLQEFQQLMNVTRSVSINNFSTINWGNGTVELLAVNFTNVLQNATEWVNVGSNGFSYNGKTWRGLTLGFNNKDIIEYRVKLHPKSYGGLIEYSILGNASGLYAEFDPLLNATAANITSDADLNLSVAGVNGFARFVDGKLIMAAGNRSNITGWDTFSDSDFNNNPVWVQYNQTGSGASGYTHGSVGVADKWLNASVNDPGVNDARQGYLRNVNVSIPPVSGIVVSGWIANNYPSGWTDAQLCIISDYDVLSNGSAMCDAGLKSNNVMVRHGNGNEFRIGDGISTTAFGAPTSTAPMHLMWWINLTHQRLIVNLTEGGSADSGLITKNVAHQFTSGAFVFQIYDNANSAVLRAVSLTNFSVANATEFGQPFNLTGARLNSNVLNFTASVGSVKISNQTAFYSNTPAQFFVHDAAFLNPQNVTEGSFNTITPITGIGINASFNPAIMTATELTSIKVEWSAPASANLPQVSISILNRTSSNASVILASEQLFSNANYSHPSNLFETNSTFKWFTNDTIWNGTQGGYNRTSNLVAMVYRDAVAYWHLDSVNGSNVTSDSSGFGNNGNLISFNQSNALAAGEIGNGLQFDGAGSYVSVLSSPSLAFSDKITVTAWVRPVRYAGTFAIVLSNAGAGSGGVVFAAVDTNAFHMNLMGVAYNTTADGSLPLNRWSHVAGTWDNSSGLFAIYVNGELSKSMTAYGAIQPNSVGGNFSIGSYEPLVATRMFNGTIDEVTVYNRSLSPSEIKQLYLRSWYDYSPQLFLLQPYKDNATGLNSSDNEKPTSSAKATNATGYYSGTFGVNLTNGFVNYSAAGNFNEKEGTIEFWVKPEWNGNDGLDHMFFSAEKLADDFAFYKRSTNDLRLYTVSAGGWLFSYDVSGWLAGDWHNVAVTWNNYTSNATLHVDGVRVNNSGTAFNVQPQDNFLLGAQVTGGAAADFCNCTISEFRISRKALSAQEINESFSKGRAFFQNEYLLNGSNYGAGDTLRLEYSPKDSAGSAGAAQNSSGLNVHAPKIADEVEGDIAIEAGINSSIPSATKYSEQQAYVRNLSNNQTLGRFDWVASFGNQRWLINYVTSGEGYVSAPNLTTAVYVLEIADKTSAQITDEVSRLINATKS